VVSTQSTWGVIKQRFKNRKVRITCKNKSSNMPRNRRKTNCGLEPYKDTSIFNLETGSGSTAPLLEFTLAQLLPGLKVTNSVSVQARTVICQRFDVTFIPKAIIDLSSSTGQALQVDNLVQVRYICPTVAPHDSDVGQIITDHPFRVLSAVNPRMIHLDVAKMQRIVGTATYPLFANDNLNPVLQIQLKNWDQDQEVLQIRVVTHVLMVPQLKPIPAAAPTVVVPAADEDE